MEDHRPRRQSLKNHHPDWKDKLRQNCLKRVQEDRAHLLWKVRSTEKPAPSQKGIVESALWNIVSDELKKIKQSSLNDCSGISISDTDDAIWEFDGLHMTSVSSESECVDLLIEMEKALHEDLKEELCRRELEIIEKTLAEEDEYLAQAVYEQMKLGNGQVGKDDRVWCPICKQGDLRENHYLIYCTCCKLQIDVQSDKVNLDFLRVRLAESHMEHLDRGCRATPNFCMETLFNLTALYIKCQTCSTFEIVV
ncbi:uncharacterized protein LOC131246028 [Magnolia sinica]|uniref:uncharacterized protein LOC131246028 n=1 Tax=Magnolia sinica TaxID=86752 RepID=UPI002657DB9C|nr:uncharacterized protein LOC131246028 [Magnolia sinica]